MRTNRITAEVEGRDPSAVFADIESYLADVRLPRGYDVSFGGERESLRESFRELSFAFLLAVILIYMILAAQFESLRYPFLMLFSIPLIVIGIFPALAVTGFSLNVSSFTGIILLIGIVVDNAALFYEYTRMLREEGEELRAAILESGKIVLRPILMNNSTTLLGLLPVALQLGEGTEFQAPLAVAVIAGLLTAVLLSLFIIPTLFYHFMKSQEPPPEVPEVRAEAVS